MGEKRPFKTKLCNLYQRGRCPRHSCSFAHGDAELRSHPLERRNDKETDLRSKLDRKRSPHHRNSHGRDSHAFRRFATSPPLKRRTREHMDGQSDFSGTSRSHDETLDHRKLLSSDPRSMLENELKQVEYEVDLLLEERSQLEIHLGERIQEVDILSSRIKDLETHLSEEKEKFTRVTSKINKLIRAHIHHSQLKDEIKRSEVQLEQLMEEFRMDATQVSSSEDHLDVNIISDGELPDLKELTSHGKRPLHISKEVPQGSKSANTSREHGVRIGGSGHYSHLGFYRNKIAEGGNKGEDIARQSGENKPKHQKDVFKSSGTSDKLKVLDSNIMAPPTSMAAHVIDDFVEPVEADENTDTVGNGTAIQNGFPFPLPPLPLASQNNYFQYEDIDVKVDVDGFDDHEELDIISM